MNGDVVLSWTDGSRMEGQKLPRFHSCRVKSGGIRSIPLVIVSEQVTTVLRYYYSVI